MVIQIHVHVHIHKEPLCLCVYAIKQMIMDVQLHKCTSQL